MLPAPLPRARSLSLSLFPFPDDLDFIYATTLACRLIGRLGGALLGDRDRVVSGTVTGNAVMPSSHVTVEGPGKIHEESNARYS